jgi:hypothetical protein
MRKTFLEKAKASPSVSGFRRSYRYGVQIDELSVAWFRGQISFGQAAAATGVRGSSLYGLLAVALRNAVFEKRAAVSLRKKVKRTNGH